MAEAHRVTSETDYHEPGLFYYITSFNPRQRLYLINDIIVELVSLIKLIILPRNKELFLLLLKSVIK